MNNINSEEISKYTLKSQTSLVGIVCKDGIVMGGDRRSTAGGGGGPGIVMGKNKVKIRKIFDNIIASYTGSVSDLELTNKVISAELKLKQLKTKEKPTIKEAANLLASMVYRNIRSPTMVPSIVGTLIGGLNEDGTTELYTIEPAGAASKVEDYDANFSSGMPYILGVLEGDYNPNITVKEGVQLAKKCLNSSIQRDPGSGNGIDIFSITKEGVKHEISEEIKSQFN